MRAGITLLVGLLILSFCCVAHAELRFGPWVYFAPYYFPPEGACNGGPVDARAFLPKYESPAPPAPSYDPGPPPEPKARTKAKVKSPAAMGLAPEMTPGQILGPPLPEVMGDVQPPPVMKQSRNAFKPITGAAELKSFRREKQK
jgi:hypothetical protein